ncbi:MAG: YjbQ family protein [bacterium]|nr:YjbQ family protein [bacterium]
MTAKTEYIRLASRANRDVIDLTGEIKSIIAESGVSDGIVTVFVPGSTAGITTIEYEPGLKKDMDNFLEKIAPYKDHYSHHETWHDDNGSSHVQAALLGPSLTVPIIEGEIALGTWQQVVLIDCDTRPRDRNVIVQIVY